MGESRADMSVDQDGWRVFRSHVLSCAPVSRYDATVTAGVVIRDLIISLSLC
jgi:hypothetical protein